jgi:DNA-binding transcriptional LysR family regulator
MSYEGGSTIASSGPIETIRAANTGRRRPQASRSPINLASIDLNLLVALDALLNQCNVTHAATTVGLSQPAMSRILSRLRDMFSDELLVRTSAGYVRTILGEWLHDQLPAALNAIRRIVSPGAATTPDRLPTVRLAMPDHQALLLGTPVNERLCQGQHNRELAIESLNGNVLKRLETGDLEMVVGEVSGASAGFYQRSLYVDGYACLLRPDHPMIDRRWTPEEFFALTHILSTRSHESETDHVADALMTGAEKGHWTTSPNTMSAAIAALDSDMVLTVPIRAARRLAAVMALRVKEPPIAIDPYRVVLLWHERSHRDAEHEWLRTQIAAVALCGGESSACH